MDLSPSGEFNYQGLEAFCGIKGLERYEWGFLPSSTAVQRCAYELRYIGKETRIHILLIVNLNILLPSCTAP
jgi:hypothetical protein